jgi:hypothetical protein
MIGSQSENETGYYQNVCLIYYVWEVPLVIAELIT